MAVSQIGTNYGGQTFTYFSYFPFYFRGCTIKWGATLEHLLCCPSSRILRVLLLPCPYPRHGQAQENLHSFCRGSAMPPNAKQPRTSISKGYVFMQQKLKLVPQCKGFMLCSEMRTAKLDISQQTKIAKSFHILLIKNLLIRNIFFFFQTLGGP